MTGNSSERFKRRLLRHHFPIAVLVTLGAVAVLAVVHSDRAVQRWSMATAYVGLALLAATLVTGPYAVLRGRRHPTSTDLRRDIGIWAGLLSLAHFVIGLQVHLKSRYLYWFRDLNDSVHLRPRIDAFGLANDLGIAAVVVAIVLLSLSNDLALRRLGARRWKRLQQWNYWLFGLVVLHAVIYEIIEKRAPGFVLLSVLIGGGAIGLQVAGARTRDGGIGGSEDRMMK